MHCCTPTLPALLGDDEPIDFFNTCFVSFHNSKGHTFILLKMLCKMYVLMSSIQFKPAGWGLEGLARQLTLCQFRTDNLYFSMLMFGLIIGLWQWWDQGNSICRGADHCQWRCAFSKSGSPEPSVYCHHHCIIVEGCKKKPWKTLSALFKSDAWYGENKFPPKLHLKNLLLR